MVRLRSSQAERLPLLLLPMKQSNAVTVTVTVIITSSSSLSLPWATSSETKWLGEVRWGEPRGCVGWVGACGRALPLGRQAGDEARKIWGAEIGWVEAGEAEEQRRGRGLRRLGSGAKVSEWVREGVSE